MSKIFTKLWGGQISLIASLVLTLLVLLPGKGWAQDSEVDAATGLKYSVANGDATITGIQDVPSNGELVIPAYIGGQYPVKAIGERAFHDTEQIKKVSFGDRSQLEKIGECAFQRCESLSEIKLPSSVTTIDGAAFMGCQKLAEIDIPSSVTTIGSAAFMNCDQLTKVTLHSEQPVNIGYDVFGIIDNFAIYVPDVAVDDYKYSWSKYADYIKPISENPGSGSASDVVTENGFMLQLDEAHHTATITGVTEDYRSYTLDLSNSVAYNGAQYTITAIGASAFMDCEFRVVKIPSSVTSIGEDAFAGAKGYYGSMQVHFAYEGNDLSHYASTAFTSFSGNRLAIVVPSANVDAYKSQFSALADNIYINRNNGEVTDDTYHLDRGYYQEQAISYTRQLTDAEKNGGYVTCCLPFTIDASEYQNMVDAIFVIDNTITKKTDGRYYLTLKNMITTEDYNKSVDPRQPMLLKLKSGVTEIKFTNPVEIFLGDKFEEYSTDMTVKDEGGTELTDLKVQLCGSKEQKTDCANIYSFNPDGTFGKHNSAILNPFRMYLKVTDANGSSVLGAAFYSSINPGDATTAISGIQAGAAQKTAAIYSIDGKKVSDNGSTASLAKGVYIQNGKKIVVK